MIGLIPSVNRTYEVCGDFTSKDLMENKLYYDKKDGRVYYYSTTETRPNPNTGYYPVWNGKEIFDSKFANKKYFDKDVLKVDIEAINKIVNKKMADEIRYRQRRSDNDEILKPSISDDDNAFTQCIKGVISAKELTIVDLIDMSPKLKPKIVENYYLALTKIAFMRFDKWNIWLNEILHVNYILIVLRDNKKLLSYKYPENLFDTGIVKYDNITSTNDDPFKKIIKILMIMENLTKNSLRSNEVDDYTINNMFTSISGDKPLSSQLFSRFIRIAGLSYKIKMLGKDGKLIFEYKE